MLIGACLGVVVTVLSFIQLQARVAGYDRLLVRIEESTSSLVTIKDFTLDFKTIRVDLRDFLVDPANRERYTANVVRLIGVLNAHVKELEGYSPTPEIDGLLADLKASLLVFYDVGGRILNFGAARNIPAATNLLLTECHPAADAVIGNVHALHEAYKGYAAQTADEFETQGRNSARNTVFVTFFSLLILVFLLAYIVVGIITPVVKIKNEMVRLSTGDLSSKFVPARGKGEIGDLSRATKEALDNLRALISRAQGSAAVVADRAANIEKTVRDMAQGNAHQSAITNEILNSIEQLSAATQEIAANSQTAANAGSSANSVVSQGAEKITAFTGALAKVQESVAALASVSKQIGGIVRAIDDISGQTNLLALNAAIEAARAGEQGRGFAVVADAVRELAKQSMDATKEISKLVDDIHVRVAQAVATSNQGAEGAKGTQEAMDAILTQINGMTHMIEGISAAGEEQAASATEVTAAMQNLNSVSREVLAAAKVSSQAAQELQGVALELQQAAAAFRL